MFYNGGVGSTNGRNGERAANVRFHDNGVNGGKGLTANGVPVFNHGDYKDWLQKRAEYNNIKMD